MPKINVILAHCSDYGIGYRGKMGWRIDADMKLFAKLTTGRGDYKNAIVMGRTTWEGLPGKRPLASRDNLILSRLSNNAPCTPHVEWFFDIEAVLSHCEKKHYDEVWVIGGEQVYSAFIGAVAPYRSIVHTVHITRIDAEITCDTFCPASTVSETAMQEYFDMVSKRSGTEKCTVLSNGADDVMPPLTIRDVIVTFCEYVNKLRV